MTDDKLKNMTKAEINDAMQQINADVVAHPEVYASKDTGDFNWEKLVAGSYSALNSALFDIPDVIAKAADSDTYKQLQALRARNKAASLTGEIGGAFIPTGGALFKAVAKAAKLARAGAKAIKAAKTAETLGKIEKGLQTGSDIIKGTKELKGISGGLARGALAAGEQVVPRYLGGETDLGTAAGTVALGAGIGAAGKAVPSMLRSAGLLNKGEGAMAPLSEALVDKELAARGLSGKDIKTSLQRTSAALGLDRTGTAINNAESVKRAALDVLKKNDILNADEAQAFIQGTGKKFEELNKLFDKSGTKISDLKDEIVSDPAVQNFIEEYGEAGKKYVNDLIGKLDKKSNLSAIKGALTDEIKFANKSTDRMGDAGGDVAQAIRDKLDEKVLSLDPNYEQYKADWKALQPLRSMVARDKMSIAKASGGSDTAAKLLATTAIGGGAALPAVLKDFDPNDPSTWSNAAFKAVAGMAIGAAANKALPGATNYLTGKVAGALNNPKFLEAAEKAGYKLSKLEAPSVAASKFFAGKLANESPEKALENVQAEVDPNGEPVADEAKEAQAAQAQTYGEEYVNKLNNSMANYWAQHFSDTMSFAEYVDKVAEKTDNFDPAKTASFLYPDKTERQKFLRDLNVTRKIKGAQESALTKKGFGASFLDPKGTKEQLKQQEDLADAIASLVTKEGDLPSEADKKTIHADLASIIGADASVDEKKQLLLDKLVQKYGLDYNTIQSLGVV